MLFGPEFQVCQVSSGRLIDAPDERNEIYEFFEFIAEEFEEEVEKKEMSENDLKVINAILVVFEDKENFADKSQNRASIHDRIREEARLDKRDVSYSIGRIKKRYEQKKIEYYRKCEIPRGPR